MITLKTTADLSKANIPRQTGGVSRVVRCDVHSLWGKKSACIGSCNIQGAGRGTGSLEPWLLADTGTDGAGPMGCLGEAAIGNPPQPSADEVWSPKALSRQLRSSCRRGRRAVTHGHAEDERQRSFPMENKLRRLPASSCPCLSSHWNKKV